MNAHNYPPEPAVPRETMAEAFADAVCGYLLTGTPHSIELEGAHFIADALEDGTTPEDVTVWIARDWHAYAPGAPESPDDKTARSEAFRVDLIERFTAGSAPGQFLAWLRRDAAEGR